MNEAARSGWMSTLHPASPKLTQDADCDTVVIGSGIAGLSTAYELSGQGQKVIVLDRGKIGRGMTARTTAHLSANNDDTFKTMIDRRGEKLARDFYESQAASITRIETIQSSESIDCDFRRVDGFLFPGPQTEQWKSRMNTRPRRRRECRCTTRRACRSRVTRARAPCAIRTRRRSIRPSICRASLAASRSATAGCSPTRPC